MRLAKRRFLQLLLCAVSFPAALGAAGANSPVELSRQEIQRLADLQKRLCVSKQVPCDYVVSTLTDPRLNIYEPPAPLPVTAEATSRSRHTNPYLTPRFGLLTTESLERCRSFVQAHSLAFGAAEQIYGVP